MLAVHAASVRASGAVKVEIGIVSLWTNLPVMRKKKKKNQ